MHRYFEAWGQGTAEARLLEYVLGDRLVAARHKAGRAAPLNLRTINRNTFAEQAAEQAIAWRGSEDRRTPDSIAILCRYNSQAREVQKAIRSRGYSCDLAAKGSFYQSPAVIEMRTLLEAVNNSADDAALLELAETRWANGVLNGAQPFGVLDVGDADDPWAETVGGLVPWRERWRTLPNGSYMRDDLDLMRARVSSLRKMLGSMALLGWLTVLVGHFAPHNVALSPHEDRAELNRYARCLTHLMSCFDEEFGSTPITLSEALLWLALQIATNENEDEPFDEDDTEGTTVAITVHKAKGLEFSRVLIPNTWIPWGVPPKARSMATLLRGQEKPAIVWRWKGLSGNTGNWNHDNLDPASPAWNDLWATDDLETKKEEARLLYVAMTRAQEELVIFRSGRSYDRTWESLLSMAEGA
jgi:ATP-dependent exoDNAse (exonuclease V) beta subunit